MRCKIFIFKTPLDVTSSYFLVPYRYMYYVSIQCTLIISYFGGKCRNSGEFWEHKLLLHECSTFAVPHQWCLSNNKQKHSTHKCRSQLSSLPLSASFSIANPLNHFYHRTSKPPETSPTHNWLTLCIPGTRGPLFCSSCPSASVHNCGDPNQSFS